MQEQGNAGQRYRIIDVVERSDFDWRTWFVELASGSKVQVVVEPADSGKGYRATAKFRPQGFEVRDGGQAPAYQADGFSTVTEAFEAAIQAVLTA